MKQVKHFDCMKVKDAIQAALRKEYAGMTDDQRHAALEEELATSDLPAARLWRRITGQHPTAAVAEKRGQYGR